MPQSPAHFGFVVQSNESLFQPSVYADSKPWPVGPGVLNGNGAEAQLGTEPVYYSIPKSAEKHPEAFLKCQNLISQGLNRSAGSLIVMFYSKKT